MQRVIQRENTPRPQRRKAQPPPPPPHPGLLEPWAKQNFEEIKGEGPQYQPESPPLESDIVDYGWATATKKPKKGKKKAKLKELLPLPPPPPPATNPTISQDKTAGTEEAQAELLAFLAQKLRLLVVCLMLLSFSIQLFSPYL
jgi:hypothetical protein